MDKKPKLVLLDTLAIIYRAYYAISDLRTKDNRPVGVLYGILMTLFKIIREFKPDYIIACYDLPKPTHRHEEYEGYKQSREMPEEDLIEQIEESRNLFSSFSIPIYQKEGFEADDIIGTFADKLKEDADIIIATGDKDLLQLVDGDKVRAMLLKRGIRETELLNQTRAEKLLGFRVDQLIDYKGLKGDASDEIPGVAGIGDKRAVALLEAFDSIENLYECLKKDRESVKKKGFSENIVKKLEDGKESAVMSKGLGTIDVNVPISTVLPEKKWKECVDEKSALNALAKYEFNSLIQVAEALLTGTSNNIQTDENKELLQEVAIAFWLLDSEKTEASRVEILSSTNTSTLEEALVNIEKQLKEENRTFVWEEIEKPLIPIIDKIEKTGIKVDVKHLQKLSKEYKEKIEKLEEKIKKETGEDFNVSSSKQLGEVIFDKLKLTSKKKTKTGAKSTKESELLKIKDEHPAISLVLEHRKYKKLLGTYVDPLLKLKDKKDRIHTQLIQNGTATGRMSSHNPNLQNIPKQGKDGKEVRSTFIAGEGKSLLSLDYSQMELRLSAILSKDQNLIDIFKENRDVHKDVAAKIFKVKLEDVTKEMREDAKTINFGVIYGMGSRALTQSLGISSQNAKNFLEEYKAQFPELFLYFEAVKKMARDLGYVETAFKRKRIIYGINSRIPSAKARAERIAINAPIQGTGADIMKLAMINVHNYIKDKDIKMLLQVHDELLFEIPTEKVEEHIPELKKKMIEGIFIKESPIPLVVTESIGKNWGELK